MTATWQSEALGTGAYAEVNGLNLYYETHGSGRPMILLHGGLGSGEMFGPILPSLTAEHQVILPDLQGHGRTADIDRPLDQALMADDIAALIDHLGLEKPDVVGYSLGGGVAFQLALRHPDRIGKLVLASVYFRSSDLHPELKAMQGQVDASAAGLMKDTPMYELYQRVAPRPEDFGRLLDKLGGIMADEFDHLEKLSGIAVPTMLVAADADQAPPSALVDAFRLLDGGLRDGGWANENRPKGGHALAILPGLTHYSIFASSLFAAVVLDFLRD